MRSLYTPDFHALRMRAVELAATLTLRESNGSRKAATAAAELASSALRRAALIQRDLWPRIVSSSIDLDRPRSTSIALDRHGWVKPCSGLRFADVPVSLQPTAPCALESPAVRTPGRRLSPPLSCFTSLALGPRARHDGCGDDPRPLD